MLGRVWGAEQLRCWVELGFWVLGEMLDRVGVLHRVGCQVEVEYWVELGY